MGQNLAKWALSEVDLGQNCAKWIGQVGTIGGGFWAKFGQVGTIGGGCGPRVDWDTLRMVEVDDSLVLSTKTRGQVGNWDRQADRRL